MPTRHRVWTSVSGNVARTTSNHPFGQSTIAMAGPETSVGPAQDLDRVADRDVAGAEHGGLHAEGDPALVGTPVGGERPHRLGAGLGSGLLADPRDRAA